MKSLYNRITSRAQTLVRRHHIWVAFGMLVLMGGLGFGSMIGNTAIVDEVAHIPAGYAYLHYGDYRLNPEHPPLIKDLAALPLQFMNLKFPDTQPAWTSDVNGQWETGWNFLYHLGNNADAILFWARLPILLLALGFGWVLYSIVRRRWGIAVGLVTLYLYCLSPNIIAHSTLVTTDLGASVFIFLALVTFTRFVAQPTRTRMAQLAIALAAAQLVKFSAALLFPFLGLMAIWFACILPGPRAHLVALKNYVGGFVLAALGSIGLVWAYYGTQVIHMPLAVQDRLIAGSLTAKQVQFVSNWLLSFNHWPLMKPLVQYLLGLSMVFGRVAGGNVTYLNGQVTAVSFHQYFPELFVVKTQLGLLLLLLGVIWYVLRQARVAKPGVSRLSRFNDHVRRHVMEWTLGLFAGFYFTVSVIGNLNLGIRHILPIYIPIFVLTAVGTVKLVRRLKGRQTGRPVSWAVAILLLWYGVSTLLVYPNFLSYFNEVIGGPANSGMYFSDSSVDWGQDLGRLKTYIAQHPEIHHIAIDYFGGAVPQYYFCDRSYDPHGRLIATSTGYDCSHSVFQEWHAQNGLYTGQYIAVSETFLENDRYYASLYHQYGYGYLRQRTPIAKIGNSIYVFKLY